MSSFTDYTEQRLMYARDILKSGEIRRALSVCEQLLSPASILTHGREIFLIISEAIELSGDRDKAEMIRRKADALFPDENVSIDSPVLVVNQFLPLLRFHTDDSFETVEYDELDIAYPPFYSKEFPKKEITIVRSEDTSKTLSALEELAQRLEHARIPAMQEEKTISNPSFMPSIVTETMANIYVQQGAYSQAIKAYQVLARNNPERLEYFESIIADLRDRQS